MKDQVIPEQDEEPPSLQTLLDESPDFLQKTEQLSFLDASFSPDSLLNSSIPLETTFIPSFVQFSHRRNLRRRNSSPFVAGEAAQEFHRRFYSTISDERWNNWHWQIQNRIKKLADLERIIQLSPDEKNAITNHSGSLPFAVTPYYASLIDSENPEQPLRRTVITTSHELLQSPGEAVDPLGEEHDMVVPGLVHRYPDRVLFLVTGFCSVYCRYCTRSRMVGNHGGEYQFSMAQWENAIDYIENHPEVRDVLLSGGDPLTLSDDHLQWLLTRLRNIPHVEMVRIGTKMPVVLPQRITPRLVSMLRKFHPLWMSIHFTHPDELTPENAQACARLADAGIPLGSQTVLLKGINDNVETMKRLMHGLIKNRVKPYYLYQCDPVVGTQHFRTSVSKGLEIIQGLRGYTTGYAVPTYVIDAPGGGGKISLIPDSVLGRENDAIILKNYQNKTFRYPDNVA